MRIFKNNLISMILLIILSSTAHSHSGHGSNNTLLHSLDHLLWLLIPAIVAILCLLIAIKNNFFRSR